MKPLQSVSSPTFSNSTNSKAQYIMKQTFNNFNAFKKYATKEELERARGNTETAKHWELEKYKVLQRLELSLRSLQHELYNEPEDD